MTDGYDSPRWDQQDDEQSSGTSRYGDDPTPAAIAADDEKEEIERSSENVLETWPEPVVDLPSSEDALAAEEEPEPPVVELPAASEPASLRPPEPEDEPVAVSAEHAPGELTVPPGYPVLEGVPRGERRAVGVVVGRFNGEVTTRLLDSALAELSVCGVAPEAVTVMPVPGAFELPLAAMALAKTRRFACIVALGCVIRGDTPHFDYVASEAASGLQLAAIETGVPVAFGVLTLDRADQADARVDKGAEAVRTALEMADAFANLRAAAAR
jgi:6,7-dimethyl-8-ribityllumazine synthase